MEKLFNLHDGENREQKKIKEKKQTKEKVENEVRGRVEKKRSAL